MRLDLLAPSPAGTLHLVHAIDWKAREFSPMCRWGIRWPAEWDDMLRTDSAAFDADGRHVCQRCTAHARWNLDRLVEEFERITEHARAVSSAR